MSSHRSARAVFVAVAAVVLAAAGVAVPMSAQAATINVANEAQLVAAAATAVSGDTINITADIALNATVLFPTGVTIQGSGAGIDISRAVNAGFTMFVFAPTAVAQDYTVADLNLDGTVGTGSGVYLFDGANDVRDATFDNVFVHNFHGGVTGAIFVGRMTRNFLVTGGSTFSDNSTLGDGGAIGSVAFFNANVKIEHSSFSGNTASGNGGAVALSGDNAFTVIVDDTTFTNNSTPGVLSVGGALYTTGLFTTVALTNDQFQSNSAFGNGGGAYVSGVLFTVAVANSTFTTNHANLGQGGGAWLAAGSSLSVNDSRFDTNTASSDGAGLLASSVNAFTMKNDTFTTNTATGFGGGMRVTGSGSIDFEGLTMTGNTANIGGGMSVADMGRLSDSVFTGNSALNAGGAIAVDVQAGDFATSRNTFSGNQVTGFGDGGATYIGSAVAGSAIRFYESTYSGNFVPANAHGASLAVDAVTGDAFFEFLEDTFNETTSLGEVMDIAAVPATASFTLGRSTMIGLTGGLSLGAIGGTADINNMIIDGDSADTGQSSVSSGNPIDTSWSILDEALNGSYTDVAGNQFSVTSPQLGPLQNNGGPTLTRLPLPGSPAIDLGDPAPGAILGHDQRGGTFLRIVNGRLDIGAVEIQAPQLAMSGYDTPPSVPLGALAAIAAGLWLMVLDRRRFLIRAR